MTKRGPPSLLIKRQKGDPPDYRPSEATRAACADLASCRNLLDFMALEHAWAGAQRVGSGPVRKRLVGR